MSKSLIIDFLGLTNFCSFIRTYHFSFTSGLHDHAPSVKVNADNDARKNKGGTTTTGRPVGRLAKQPSAGMTYVVKRHINDTTGDLISNRPLHYSVVQQQLSIISKQLKTELSQRFDKRVNNNNNRAAARTAKGSKMIYKIEEMEPGYFRGHIGKHVSAQLKSLDFLPSHFQVKESAPQQGIIFYNRRGGTCDTHFDRDSSMLCLVTGFKEVKIARPMRECDRPDDGIMHELNPFSRDKTMLGGFQWETLHMVPGDVSCFVAVALFFIHQSFFMETY